MPNAHRTPATRAAWWLAIPITASLGGVALAQQPSASGSSPQVHQAEVAGAAACERRAHAPHDLGVAVALLVALCRVGALAQRMGAH